MAKDKAKNTVEPVEKDIVVEQPVVVAAPIKPIEPTVEPVAQSVVESSEPVSEPNVESLGVSEGEAKLFVINNTRGTIFLNGFVIESGCKKEYPGVENKELMTLLKGGMISLFYYKGDVAVEQLLPCSTGFFYKNLQAPQPVETVEQSPLTKI